MPARGLPAGGSLLACGGFAHHIPISGLHEIGHPLQTAIDVGIAKKLDDFDAGVTEQEIGQPRPVWRDDDIRLLKHCDLLRVAVLRQEFVDELVPTRTLKEEMLSIFEEENAIMQELSDVEAELAGMGEDGDQNRMQDILDRMQELQNKAEEKDVLTLESRVTKVMDLMGFMEDEADDLVSSFSGGWKMRIGLGKVLLKDPNILLLGKNFMRGKIRQACLFLLLRCQLCSHYLLVFVCHSPTRRTGESLFLRPFGFEV